MSSKLMTTFNTQQFTKFRSSAVQHLKNSTLNRGAPRCFCSSFSFTLTDIVSAVTSFPSVTNYLQFTVLYYC